MPFAVCSAYVCSSCAGSFPQTRNLPQTFLTLTPPPSPTPLPYPFVQEFEKDVAEQREKLPSLQEDADELWEEYAPGQWLKDKMAALEDMFDQLDQLCASRKGYLGRLCHEEKANTCRHSNSPYVCMYALYVKGVSLQSITYIPIPM